MRLPLVLLAILIVPMALASQTRPGVLVQPKPATPAPRPVPRVRDDDDHDRYRRVHGTEVPLISMDSAVTLIQAKYDGWFVNSKETTHEHWRLVYRFGVICAGVVGDHYLIVDANTGEILNPQVVGDTTGAALRAERARGRVYLPGMQP